MRTSSRQLKRQLYAILREEDFSERMAELHDLPVRKLISPLFSFFCSTDEICKWRAVSAVGEIVARLADDDMESARVVMRRLMWTLNDESGGIGWGAPEAMGEIMTGHRRLADEYACILVSYADVNQNFLELAQLQRGVIWGIGRLAGVRPGHVRDAGPHLEPFLESPDPWHRGLAAWAIGALGRLAAAARIASLTDDPAPLRLYEDRVLKPCTVGQLARRARRQLSDRRPHPA
jgi:hypothetical protein